MDAAPLAKLEEGDEIIPAGIFIEEGIEWVKLARGATATRRNPTATVPLGLSEEGFVPTEHPVEGTLLTKHHQVAVEERREEGVLTKAQIKAIVDRSSDPSLQLPLEAKYWGRQQLEMFVMSGGTIRPKGCSMPDERLMANINMGQEEVARALEQAAGWLAEADVLLIGSGAGMGVDSGLGTFRGGHRGVWQGLEAVGLAYEEICDPRWFREEPHLGWAFWEHCHRAYQETAPHEGYARVRDLAQRCPLGFFSFTSNIDSHWIASGLGADRVLEVHGAVRWLQCSKPCCPDVWKAPKDLGLTPLPTHRVSGILPTCPKCKAIARPNVQMFGGDAAFSKARRAAQFSKYDAWLKQLEARPDKDSLRVTCLEVGCGLTVPTVRKELEAVVQRFPQARLIRVNPENPGLSQELARKGVSLPLRAGLAIEELQRRADAAVEAKVVFVMWGKEGSAEVAAPFGSSPSRVLRLAEMQEGFSVQQLGARVWCMGTDGKGQEINVEEAVPACCFREVKSPAGGEMRMLATLIMEARFLDAGVPGVNAELKRRIREVQNLLDDMNALFAAPEYQALVRNCPDRRSVMKTVRTVQYQVLPKYGIEASERGTMIMSVCTSAVEQFPEIQESAHKSMHLSYVGRMGHLPNIAPSSEARPRDTAVAGADAPAVLVDAAQAPAPSTFEVALAALSADGAVEDEYRLQISSQSSLGDLRRRLAEVFSWDQEMAAAAEFAAGPATASGGALLQDSEAAIQYPSLLLRRARLRRPPEVVEVAFVQMAPEDGGEPETFRLRVLSDRTIAELRSLLGEHMGWSDGERRSSRFLMRLANGAYGGLKDTERLDARRTVFVHGAPLKSGAAVTEGSATEAAQLAGAVAAGRAPPERAVAEGPGSRSRAPPAAAVVTVAAQAVDVQGPRSSPSGANAPEERGTWSKWPNHDCTGMDLESMSAKDLEAVKRRAESIGASGFSVWNGQAFLKKMPKRLTQQDLEYKGKDNHVEFYLFTPLALSLEKALSLQRGLLEGYAHPDFQKALQELRRMLDGRDPKKFTAERNKLLNFVHAAVLPNFGFEANLAGSYQVLEALSNPAFQKSEEFQRNHRGLMSLVEGKARLPGW